MRKNTISSWIKTKLYGEPVCDKDLVFALAEDTSELYSITVSNMDVDGKQLIEQILYLEAIIGDRTTAIEVHKMIC